MLNISSSQSKPVTQAAHSRGKWPEHPFRGLNFFSTEDAPLFGERDEDLDACEEMLTKMRTRMLLLHGRSGTGKSSFIRAGLLPRLDQRNSVITLVANDSKTEATVIRCTADPVARIAIFLRVSGRRNEVFERILAADRQKLRQMLTVSSGEPRMVLAQRLVEALAMITPRLDRPLLLVIDQGEEVLALPDHGTDAREAFFWLLEELCWHTKIG